MSSDRRAGNADISQLLVAWSSGDQAAFEQLAPLVYQELRHLARRHMRSERREHTLQATALVNEAYLRLVEQKDASWQHRSQFFAVAARIMRRILVDHARRRRYEKRGAGAVRISLDDVALVASAPTHDILALDEALEQLHSHDPRKCQVVELRYFGGLTVEEVAEHLSVSPVTVKRDWALAKSWLYRAMATAPGR